MNKILELTHKISGALEKHDIFLLSAGVYVYDVEGRIYTSLDEIYDAIKTNDIAAFIDIDALIDERVWEHIEA